MLEYELVHESEARQGGERSLEKGLQKDYNGNRPHNIEWHNEEVDVAIIRDVQDI